MALSSKDAITTVFAAGTVGILYVQSKGVDVAVLSSPRWSSLLVFLLGIGMCIIGSDSAAMKTSWGTSMAVAGGLVLLAAIIGLITNNRVYVELGATLVLIMWLFSTGRHLFA